MRTYGADASMIAGVTSPIKTAYDEIHQINKAEGEISNPQLFDQLDAVARDTPLLLIDKGNTSLGSTQPEKNSVPNQVQLQAETHRSVHN